MGSRISGKIDYNVRVAGWAVLLFMRYSTVADYFERLEATSGRLQMTEILSSLFKETPKPDLPLLIYLMQGKLRPDFEGIELGIAEKFALRAISTASGKTPQQVKEAYIKAGDIGSAAQALLQSGSGGARQEPLVARSPLAEEGL